MEYDEFSKSDLVRLDWQYTTVWHNVTDFELGQKVFLKSNPEHQLVVHELGSNSVLTCFTNSKGDIQYLNFKPECLLQYEFACLVTYKKDFLVCLN